MDVGAQRDDARRARAAGLVGLSVLALVCAACSSWSGPAADTQRAGDPPTPSKPAVTVDITPAASASINPMTPIVVHATRGTLTKVAVTDPAKGSQLTGSLSPDNTTWTSTPPLAYATNYAVVADAVDAAHKSVEETGTVHTIAPAATAFPSMIPAPNSGFTFGVGQIIGVSFDHDITDQTSAERALSVTSTPQQPGAWHWIDKRTVHYRPQNYWQPGTAITLHTNVFGVDLGNGVYGETNRTATYNIHDSWIAHADGNSETMQVLHNGQLVNTMAVSLGSPGYPTHEGPHVISDKQPSIIMDSCTYGVCKGQRGYYRETVNLDERISNDGEFVHSAPWSVGQQGSSNVSHGCVNLSPANASWFYGNFNLGDVVEISHSGGSALQIWDTYGDWELPWPQWLAGSALR